MPAQTQSQIYNDREGFTVYRPRYIEETRIDSHKTSDRSQSAIWSTYPHETTAKISPEEVGNTVIRQEEITTPSETTPKTSVIRKSEVPGAVISIEDVSVVCEVYLKDLQERTMIIRLPKSLFPEDIFYGAPITITYRKDRSGIRRPGVTLRKIVKTERMTQEDREMEAFIKNL